MTEEPFDIIGIAKQIIKAVPWPWEDRRDRLDVLSWRSDGEAPPAPVYSYVCDAHFITHTVCRSGNCDLIHFNCALYASGMRSIRVVLYQAGKSKEIATRILGVLQLIANANQVSFIIDVDETDEKNDQKRSGIVRFQEHYISAALPRSLPIAS